MNYIKKSEEKEFTLNDFYNGTKFSIRANSNEYKTCNVIITNSHYNDRTECTEIEVIVWTSKKGCGKHIIEINDVNCNIIMKDLLIELSEKFANVYFEKDKCYIEVDGKYNFIF